MSAKNEDKKFYARITDPLAFAHHGYTALHGVDVFFAVPKTAL